MPFQKIVMPTMKELFVRQMESMILSGELAAGEQHQQDGGQFGDPGACEERVCMHRPKKRNLCQ